MLPSTAATAITLAAACAVASAIAPRYESDHQIGQYPIIVLARWNKAPKTPHELVKGNVQEQFEVFTDLEVVRVIKGDIRPGTHRLLYAWGVDWLEDGTGLATWTSTHIAGEVEDVTKPSLWFLMRARSWDEADATSYLSLPHYRAIQSPVLEPYFAAIGSGQGDSRIPELLTSDDPLVVSRSLRYICGEVWPWPYDSQGDEGSTRPEKRERLLTPAADAVLRVIEHGPDGVRSLAVALYAELAAERAADKLRALVDHRDAKARATAVAILARRGERLAVPAMVRAVAGLDDDLLACKLMDALLTWQDDSAAPVFIQFLERDSYARGYENNVALTAIKARIALHELTECWFPFSVAEAAAIWEQAGRAGDAARMRRLKELLAKSAEAPLIAELIGSPEPVNDPPKEHLLPPPHPDFEVPADLPARFDDVWRATVRITNTSAQSITITRLPRVLRQRWRQASAGRAMGPIGTDLKREDFVTLPPGGNIEFEIRLLRGLMQVSLPERIVELTYSRLRLEPGSHGWIGTLTASFGPEWRER